MLLLSVVAHADSTAVQKLEGFISRAKNIQAKFTQVSLDELGKVMQTSQGDFYLQQPGKFRWNYNKPYEQQIVSKDGKVWFYDADLEQLIIKKIDQSIGDTPALLLSGSVDLNEKYTIVKQRQEGDILWLKLTPKNTDSSFKYILVGLKGDMLYGMELSDNFGQLTQIIFSDVTMPKSLAPDLFEFIVPEGTDVFEG
ncbi:outer membrane lipoprotein carrier protein LolA [Methylococcaceae bacterium HT4]|nr:outer membrane lipoprotein chaperone LolA [Methyloprofundus sp.]TXK98008.1 outer membrane lipoprotein carrier protein LolA [Methylococcaceae bacterium CS4]TXL00303.1 outer membrane lipoprotein carrier protein LolA [Methylococcaceae bacterium CS5]TXL05902.1 outer membrane lipoprotein carrier protein LolA [Methylococcaceae bacterium CS1]TXL07113.1 outer membrane lipoprotein carrier protein LolA [Methylococcaceae bacterium CS3]TXL11741.1 outer membrane lipoprotein carrier protein LolA [Methylo